MTTQPQAAVKLTPFAKKYGVAKASNNPLLNSLGRSGLTPTLPPSIIPEGTLGARFPSDIPNPVVSDRDRGIEHAQRFILKGFTSRELVDYGAFPDPNAKPSDLITRIEDIINIDNWESPERPPPQRKIFIPIVASGEEYSLPDNPGTWQAQNPVIWKILKPVLVLASRFMTNMHTTLFYDALLEGEFRELPPKKWAPKPDDPRRYSFHARLPEDRDAAAGRKKLREVFAFLKNKKYGVKFSIGFGHESYPVRLDIPDIPANNGFTWSTFKNDLLEGIYISLNIDLYQPLLRNDMNTSERLIVQTNCAKTLLHELTHALHRTLCIYGKTLQPNNNPFILGSEPFFEDQIFSELGFAHEISVFGTTHFPFIDRGRFQSTDKRNNYPRLGYFSTNYPQSTTKSSPTRRLLDGAKLPDFDTFGVVPSKYYETIHTQDFWEVMVRKYGVEVVQPRCPVHTTAAKVGSKTVYSAPIVSTVIPDWENNWPDDVKRLNATDPADLIKAVLSMNGSEKRVFTAEFQGKTDRDVDTEDVTISKLQDLSTALGEEAEKHSKEIASFKIREDKDINHQAFLEELNHHMRNMAIKFQKDTKRIQLNGDEVQKAADEIINRLDTCLLMLHGTSIESDMDQLDFYRQTKAKVTPAVITALVAASLYGRMDTTERDILIQEGAQAIIAKNKPECQKLGDKLLKDYADVPFFSATAKLLLSCSGLPQHADLAEWLLHDERASLEKPNNDCDESTRKLWLGLWMNMSTASQKRKRDEVPCGDREDDGDALAEQNQLFLKKFRHE